MSARIIPFVEARQHLIAKRSVYNHIDLLESTVNSSHSILPPQCIDTTLHYNRFISAMCTRHHAFMFPSILSNYRRGINPVDALYNELQKVLFVVDEHDNMRIWILSLFKDEQWVAQLQYALLQDCIAIEQYAHNTDLYRVRNNFVHYIEVFNLIKDYVN